MTIPSHSLINGGERPVESSSRLVEKWHGLLPDAEYYLFRLKQVRDGHSHEARAAGESGLLW